MSKLFEYIEEKPINELEPDDETSDGFQELSKLNLKSGVNHFSNKYLSKNYYSN